MSGLSPTRLVGLTIVLLAGCLAHPQESPSATPAPSSDAAPALGPEAAPPTGVASIRTQTVCFTADFTRNVEPKLPVIVSGTLYTPANLTDRTRAFLLVHGMMSNGTNTWDGGPALFGVANNTTLARMLVHRGYAVFTIDRPGFGNSPYPDGRKLTLQSYVEVIADIVAEIKSGTYGTSATACPGDARATYTPASLILGGHSFGAGIVQTYFPTTPLADGLVTFDMLPSGLGPEFAQGAAACAAKTEPTATFVKVACTREVCVAGFYNEPGFDPATVDAICDPARLPSDPVAELSDLPYFQSSAPQRVAHGGAILVIHAGCPTAGTTCFNQEHDAEASEWRTLCSTCTVTDLLIHTHGGGPHGYFHYPKYNAEVNAEVMSWLAASRLGPTVGD